MKMKKYSRYWINLNSNYQKHKNITRIYILLRNHDIFGSPLIWIYLKEYLKWSEPFLASPKQKSDDSLILFKIFKVKLSIFINESIDFLLRFKWLDLFQKISLPKIFEWSISSD